MAEYKTSKQVNYGFGLSFEATGKAPVIAKRIWATLADAQAYVDSTTDTATKGLILTVVGDAENNGVYFVRKAAGDAAGETSGTLQKISGNSDFTTFETLLTNLGLRVADIEGDDAKSSMRDVAEDVRSALTLAYDSDKKLINLNAGGTTITSLNATAFVKDGMLTGTALYSATAATGSVTIGGKAYSLTGLTAGHKYIVLAFNGDGPTAPITLDVNELVDVYTAGTGLLLDAKTNQFSINRDTINEWIAANTTVKDIQSKLGGVISAVVDSASVNGMDIASYDGQTGEYSGNNITLDGANVKTGSAINTSNDIKIAQGTALDTAIQTVATKTQEALNIAKEAQATSGVTDVENITGKITFADESQEDGAVNFSITGTAEGGVISAEVKNLKSAAFKEDTDFASYDDGEKARTALQSIKVSKGAYVEASVADKTNNLQVISIAVSATDDIENATTGDYLADAAAVKTYVDSKVTTALTWGSWN